VESANASLIELVVDDGTKYVVSRDSAGLKIGDVKVMVPDIVWGKGVIHVLTEDLK
jgi:hypothetical protein